MKKVIICLPKKSDFQKMKNESFFFSKRLGK